MTAWHIPQPLARETRQHFARRKVRDLVQQLRLEKLRRKRLRDAEARRQSRPQ